jgi:hypothetical protein
MLNVDASPSASEPLSVIVAGTPARVDTACGLATGGSLTGSIIVST